MPKVNCSHFHTSMPTCFVSLTMNSHTEEKKKLEVVSCILLHKQTTGRIKHQLKISRLKSSWHQLKCQYFKAPGGTLPSCPPLSQLLYRGYGRCSPPPSSLPSQSKLEPLILPPSALDSITACTWPRAHCLLGVKRKRWRKPRPPGYSWELPRHRPTTQERTSLQLLSCRTN